MFSALAYPVLAALVQWLAGLPIRFGEAELVAASAWQARLFFVFCTGVAAGLLFFFAKPKPWLHWPSFIAAIIIWSQTPRLAAWLGLEIPAATVAVIEVALMATIGAADAVAGAVTIAIASAVASAVIFVIVVSFAAMVADWIFEERNRPPGFRILLLLLLLALLSAALPLRALMTEESLREADIYLILMLGLFPLLNALADFASTGLTRLLLRAGLAQLDSKGIGPRQSRLWLWGLDVLGGLAAFAALGCAAIAWIHFIRPPQGPLIDLPALFAGLAARPGEYWWLGAMLLTTLLPTLAHIAMALRALVLSPPAFVRRWIVEALDAGDAQESRRITGTLLYCALQTAAFWAPIWLALGLWRVGHDAMLTALRLFFEGFARLIGAI